MQNGHDTQANTVQIDTRQAAVFGLQFLEQVAHTRAQRDAYDMATRLLQAIAAGQVVLSTPSSLPQAAPQLSPDER